MSLNWDTSECERYQKLKAAHLARVAANLEASDKEVEFESGMLEFIELRDAVVWGTLCTRYPPGPWKITEENWKEMFTRLLTYEKLYGAMRKKSLGGFESMDIFFTPEEIRSLIGLTTNVGNYTNRQFWAEIARRLKEQAKDHLYAMAENL